MILHRVSASLSFVCTVLLVLGAVKTIRSCKIDQQDSFIINRILERQLVENCNTIYTLAGIFFENQEKPPNAVKVKYIIQIPYNDQCGSECPCWIRECNHTEHHCDPGHCCIVREMLWGRLPMYVQDSIFRQLSMCSLVVGGLKEKSITISFNITDDMLSSGGPAQSTATTSSSECFGSEFPCSWCYSAPELSGNIVESELVTDTVFTIARSKSPLDKALLTLTAKLQGYAAKAEKLDWLMYSSDLAFGYSEQYQDIFPLTARMIMYFIYYTSFQLTIFMLVYKYRYRIYNNIHQYVNRNNINRSLFWSFVLTTILAFACVLVIALVAGGICMTVLQIIMLCVAVGFGLPHGFVSFFRMKKTTNKALLIIPFDNKVCSVINTFIERLLFSFIYILPHIVFFWLMNYFVSFIARPFSYLLFLVYFFVSSVFIWIANAIGIHLLFPLSCTRGLGCRRQMFAIFLISACNCLNFCTWGFIEVYFYDRRAQATSFITVLPGIVFTLLGWYLSGDLVKLFDMMLVVTLPVKSSQVNEDTNLIISNIHISRKESTGSVNVIDSEIYPEEVPKRKYNFTRLKRFINVVQRPTSVMVWSRSPSDGYVDIDNPILDLAGSNDDD